MHFQFNKSLQYDIFSNYKFNLQEKSVFKIKFAPNLRGLVQY